MLAMWRGRKKEQEELKLQLMEEIIYEFWKGDSWLQTVSSSFLLSQFDNTRHVITYSPGANKGANPLLYFSLMSTFHSYLFFLYPHAWSPSSSFCEKKPTVKFIVLKMTLQSI